MINFNSQFKIKDFCITTTKKGDPMGNLILENCENNEILNCKIWDNNLQNIPLKTLRTGNIVKIEGDYNPEFKNYIVKNILLSEEAPLGLDKEIREKLFNNVMEIVNNFNDDLKSAVSNFLYKNAELVKITPAAKTNHHNYVGGLLQHIYECTEYAKCLFPVFAQKTNQETILAACIMHDIGKIFEYKIDVESGLIEYNDKFIKEWISHSQFGYSWAMNNNFNKLARIIATHHGRKSWGALIDLDYRENANLKKEDIEPDQYLVHHIDDLSAKFGLISVDQLKKTPSK